MDKLILSTPVYYALELTPVCNNHCPACSNGFPPGHPPLPASEWQRILDRVAPHASFLKLTGGEPTLHPEFERIIQIISMLDIPFTLFTNARWSAPAQIINWLSSTTCQGLLVSLHSADARTHEAFTQQAGSFAETVENIRLAIQAGFRVHISTVLSRSNWDQLPDVVALGERLGAQYAVFNRYIGSENPSIEPDIEQLTLALGEIKRLQKHGKMVKFGNCIPQCFASNTSKGCWAGTAYGTIDPWGNLRPCNHSPLVIGNVLETSLQDLWHSEKIERWRALLPATCQLCNALASCQGGCRAMLELRDCANDPLATQPLSENQLTPREMLLFEGARPTLACVVKPEPFGYVLIQGAALYPVPQAASRLLQAYTGQYTLYDIYLAFGQDALNLTGDLYQHGLLALE